MSAQYIYLKLELETFRSEFFRWNWSVKMILDRSFHDTRWLIRRIYSSSPGTLRKHFHWPGSRLGRFPQHRTWRILRQRRFLGCTGSPFLHLTSQRTDPPSCQLSDKCRHRTLLQGRSVKGSAPSDRPGQLTLWSNWNKKKSTFIKQLAYIIDNKIFCEKCKSELWYR